MSHPNCYKSLTHGHSVNYKVTRTYVSWVEMRRRVRAPNRDSAKHYVGRGITVCDRWQEYPNFLTDMGERPDGMTLERKDTNGNYEPGNCKWATMREQNRNQRSTKLTFEKAVTIALRSLSGMTGKRAAEPFGVSEGVTYQIMGGTLWSDALPEAYHRFAFLP